MTNEEKIESLKSAIFQLYTNEGRSKSYISRLLEVDRKILSNKINYEWKFEQNKSKRHMKPSNKKFLNKHRDFIKSKLDKDVHASEIADMLGVKIEYLLQTIIPFDKTLNKALEDKKNRASKKAEERRLQKEEKRLERINKSNDIEEIVGEEWKEIVGHSDYYISSEGRVYSTISSKLLKPTANKNNGRMYIGIQDKNLQLHRLVAFHFVPKENEEQNTVNHINGDVADNRAINLEWTTQSENNLHAYRELNRTVNKGKRYKFDYILYKGKYEFKTVQAFAKFLNKSETQTRRYIDNAEKHEIELITKEAINTQKNS